MKNKAAHEGHCQACGSLQKLPDGKLSKHGYTVEWSCFVGTCPGSHHLPFEQDCSLIQSFIGSAQRSLMDCRAQIAELNAPAQESRGLNREYFVSANRLVPGKYVWVSREVFEFTHFEEGYSYNSIVTMTDTGRAERTTYWNGETALDIAAKMNQSFAERELNPEAKKLAEYISWQQNRVANWAPKPLQPVNDLPVDPHVLRTPEGQYISHYSKEPGRYGSYQKPGVAVTDNFTQAKVFTRRSAVAAQRHLFKYGTKTTVEVR